MKVYIMTDMEGISGVRTMNHVIGDKPEFKEGQQLLCGDINAAVEGALDAGAETIVVNDGHGGSPANILMELLHPAAIYDRPVSKRNWAPALDETFDACFLVGAHAMAGTLHAFLEHTQSSAQWFNYYINGRKCGEIGQMAAVAGYYKAPLVLVTGDKAATAEASELIEGIETVTVKEAFSRNTAVCIHPEKAHAMIRAAARRALERRSEIPPWIVEPPIEIKLELQRTDYCDSLAANEGVERLDGRTVRKIVHTPLHILDF